MSFFSKLFGWAHHVGVVVGSMFVKLFGSDAATAFAKAALSILKSDLGNIVLEVVAALEAIVPAMAGDTKRAQAIDQVLSAAKAAGIDATKSIVALLVELAVAYMKGHYGPAPSAVSALPAVAPVTAAVVEPEDDATGSTNA